MKKKYSYLSGWATIWGVLFCFCFGNDSVFFSKLSLKCHICIYSEYNTKEQCTKHGFLCPSLGTQGSAFCIPITSDIATSITSIWAEVPPACHWSQDLSVLLVRTLSTRHSEWHCITDKIQVSKFCWGPHTWTNLICLSDIFCYINQEKT